jgi:hypothetical protein
MQALQTPVVHKTYELLRLLHETQKKIPKQERYTLWQRCEVTALDALQELLMITYRPTPERREHLISVSGSIDVLRVLIRLASDIKIIDQKRYLTLQEHLDEIGRMLGGWIKSIK